MTTSEYPKPNDDLISNVFDILPDKILQLLAIRDAARTSVLSKQWRCNWLSLKRLVFDAHFFINGGRGNSQECNSIISSILLNHDGPVHEFTIHIPQETNEKCLDLNQWLCFLSKNGLRLIKIHTGHYLMSVPSNIFWCCELIHLELFNLTIHPPPSGFCGFSKLRHLILNYIQFSQEFIFPCLMAKCPKLVTLTLDSCSGMGDIVIDAPNLETLIIVGLFECKSIALRDIRNLKSIRLQLFNTPEKSPTIDSFDNLASSCQLQCIEFNGIYFNKFLAAGSFKKARPYKFNHLNKLSLSNLRLHNPDVLRNIFDMLECCPYIKELYISIRATENDNHQRLDYSKVYKSTHLVEVKIMGIAGTTVELQLIECLFTIAVALERFLYKSKRNLDTESEMKLLKAVSRMPRASPKACLICF